MKSILRTALTIISILPFAAIADEWSAEQQEVIDFEITCWNADTAEETAACFNEDYEGWVLAAIVPMNKADRVALAADSFDDSLTVNLFKPMSVIIKGNVAVVNYVIFYEVKDAETGEVENFAQRWIDVAAKENGKWSWISDFGRNVGNE